MPYDVKLPDIGEGIAEGEIVRWLVKAGDAVKEDQPLVEVMTDKASVEIPSPRTGTIASQNAEEGAMVPVGSVIVSIALPGEGVATAAPVAAAPAAAHGGSHVAGAVVGAGAAMATAGAAASALGIQATPAVRALARELGVTLENLRGTGPGGRIVADDVRSAAAGATGGTPSGEASARPGGSAPAAGAHGAAPATHGADADSPEERVALRGLRRKIAEHMRRSLSTAAQFTFVAECDFTDLAAHRATQKAAAERAGIKLTYLAYVFRALIEPLRQFPLLNAALDDATQEIVIKRYYNLGIATNTEEGLTVPILHHADRLSLFALAREIERLSAAARARHLKLEELHGGTFTVTSTGAHGGVLATPILHHPQVAILGVHEVKKRPAVVNGQIVARDLGNLSLSLDHRVVDGAVGADFLYALVARLESASSWLTAEDLR